MGKPIDMTIKSSKQKNTPILMDLTVTNEEPNSINK